MKISPISDQEIASAISQITTRKDLREKAFRRYEPYIVAASKSSYQVKLSENPELARLQPNTFIARMRDAMLARDKFKYHSEGLGNDFNRRLITFKVIDSDTVMVILLKPSEAAQITKPEIEIEITDDNVIPIRDQFKSNSYPEQGAKVFNLICRKKLHFNFLQELSELECDIFVHLIE